MPLVKQSSRVKSWFSARAPRKATTFLGERSKLTYTVGLRAASEARMNCTQKAEQRLPSPSYQSTLSPMLRSPSRLSSLVMPEETRLRCARSIVPSPLIRWRGP